LPPEVSRGSMGEEFTYQWTFNEPSFYTFKKHQYGILNLSIF